MQQAEREITNNEYTAQLDRVLDLNVQRAFNPDLLENQDFQDEIHSLALSMLMGIGEYGAESVAQYHAQRFIPVNSHVLASIQASHAQGHLEELRTEATGKVVRFATYNLTPLTLKDVGRTTGPVSREMVRQDNMIVRRKLRISSTETKSHSIHETISHSPKLGLIAYDILDRKKTDQNSLKLSRYFGLGWNEITRVMVRAIEQLIAA